MFAHSYLLSACYIPTLPHAGSTGPFAAAFIFYKECQALPNLAPSPAAVSKSCHLRRVQQRADEVHPPKSFVAASHFRLSGVELLLSLALQTGNWFCILLIAYLTWGTAGDTFGKKPNILPFRANIFLQELPEKLAK